MYFLPRGNILYIVNNPLIGVYQTWNSDTNTTDIFGKYPSDRIGHLLKYQLIRCMVRYPAGMEKADQIVFYLTGANVGAFEINTDYSLISVLFVQNSAAPESLCLYILILGRIQFYFNEILNTICR